MKDFLTNLVFSNDKGDGTLGTMSTIIRVASETAERMRDDKDNDGITQSPPPGKPKLGAASTPKSINTQADESQLIE